MKTALIQAPRGGVFLSERKNMEDINLTEEKNELLGELDSLNVLLGLAASLVQEEQTLQLIAAIQHDLFAIGAQVAQPPNVIMLPTFSAEFRAIKIQREIALIEQGLPPISHFIIPGGHPGACVMHCARTVARKIERMIPGYLESTDEYARYFDQQACLLFVLARYINCYYGVKEQAVVYPTHSQKELTMSQQNNFKALKKAAQRAAAAKRANEAAQEKKRLKAERKQSAAERRFRKWWKPIKAQVVQAAKVVWDWYQSLPTQARFLEVAKTLSEAKLCLIFKRMDDNVPPYAPDGYREKSQHFTLEFPGQKLFIHDLVKYGRCHQIFKKKDLMEDVEPFNLISFAQLITNGTVWDEVEVQ